MTVNDLLPHSNGFYVALGYAVFVLVFAVKTLRIYQHNQRQIAKLREQNNASNSV